MDVDSGGGASTLGAGDREHLRVGEDNLTDSERRHNRNVSASAMLLSQAPLEITEAASELYQHDTELYQQMLASAERIREDTRRAAQEIERIMSLKTS
jgi:hypothetical protein